MSKDRVWSVDVDFQDDRREEVIEYVRRKYGEECVSNIITYGSMKSKSAIRDVARIYDHSPSFGDKIAKLVPEKAKNLVKALEESEEFNSLYNANSDVKRIVDTAVTIEGLPKSTGKHACFDKDTLISTDKGLKRIVDVQIGDKVLTHKLRYKPVVDLIETQTNVVYTIVVPGLKPIKVTGNHPLYVKSGYKAEKAQWKDVVNIDFINDYLAIPLQELHSYTDYNFNIDELSDEIFFSDQLMWVKLQSIEFDEMSQLMYNLTVLDDSSYIAGGIVAHNCGVIIAPDAITNFIPQVVVLDETGKKDIKGGKIFEPVMVTQLDMAECEELGLLKMDFLGLRNLSVIAGTLELINKNRLIEGLPLLTMDDIPITDPFAYKHIQNGNTIGVFQLESSGMTNLVSETYTDIDRYVKEYITDKKVNEKGIGVFDERFDPLFERLIALISLYRPGPMDEIPNYLHNMNNPQDIKYDTPQLKDILSNTYGIIVYQEQVMHAVREMAGFSKGQSDVIRKAMGKKKKDIVDEYGEYFIYGSEESDKKRERDGEEPYKIKGCIANGISEEVAKEVWGKMYKFAEYAFNKSHATGYAVISIRTAWLSYYYPLEFMTALLNSNINKNEKLEYYVAKIKSLGFNMLGPDINKSQELFSISYEESGIRFGLRGIKGLGKSSETVIGARGIREFTSLTDFVERLNEFFKCDKKILENIARCGGFESIEPNRKAIADSAEMIVNSLKKTNSKNISGQINLFDMFAEDESISSAATLQLVETEDYTKDEKLFYEKDLLSFYVSGHPLDKYDKIIKEAEHLTFTSDIKMALEIDDSENESFGFNSENNNTIENIVVLGQISEIKEIITKAGDAMCVITLEDKHGEIGCVVFPKTRTAYRSKIIKGQIVVVSGKAVRDDFGIQIIVSDISSPHILSSENKPSTVILKCPFSKVGPERERAVNLFRAFKRAVDSFQGVGTVDALFVVDGETFNLGTIPSDVDVLVKLRRMFGEDKIEFIA